MSPVRLPAGRQGSGGPRSGKRYAKHRLPKNFPRRMENHLE